MENNNFENIKKSAESFYGKIGKVNCPALKELVYFNSEGFNHLLYKNKSVRTQKEQALKLKFLAIGKEIIELSTTYQEYDESLKEIQVKQFKRKVMKTVMIKYWGLVAIIRGCRVKVIVRQIGEGKKHFWSVMPTWGYDHYRDTKFVIKSKGNLDED
ncbi:MAG: hypothetical protein US83_C0003G0044 [Candidatus Falkowbacteria bacterium GW2011_GWC2_38_22]|uniref:Uncharacterized protein n=1 Tax=Candidatus Falkowbacteria bacterium GW2011_GWE1_38_31 TaxID=1618638 RepID=A0A0G0MBU1_9BACT|nr:MAG: hypothetical protein US73_C0001G0136 [Candidatus Falkowbacteria bacterium GW2011_GWF2_38_1205]KKQ61795.1 MAG: hypothetical protein US83_C0003G0044 [Candidatus Falkowbacteria bacterium GW2011_GWC2_38_22]KKQ64103.1 MAG: hypothetical protein US84_C0002G0135 [Candidatus Falkowbacteria bacterium GW2011_GWF1_38_22]KKQ66547.1 MAG: hypothetical protein US87_C0001G0068 [Candidatus Falkowbacteria bacterium GW2011_GWE2_38_254]KKQ71209.1 MAG: hypothetical protein US91_C0001G0136 [Candidatus Falkowb